MSVSDIKPVFQSAVFVQPHIPDDDIEGLIASFEDPAYCRDFVRTSGNGNRAQPGQVLKLFCQSTHPRAKSVVKNVLLYGSPRGNPLKYDDLRAGGTINLIDKLDPADRKDVLCKPRMFVDLIESKHKHRDDKKVFAWINEYECRDKLDILCTDLNIQTLLEAGHRKQFMEWFNEQSDDGKRRMLCAEGALASIIKAYKQGEKIARHYLFYDERLPGGFLLDPRRYRDSNHLYRFSNIASFELRY